MNNTELLVSGLCYRSESERFLRFSWLGSCRKSSVSASSNRFFHDLFMMLFPLDL